MDHYLMNHERERLTYYERNFHFCVGDEEIDEDSQIKLMQRVAIKLRNYHSEGKLHSNVHPTNILFSEDLQVCEFMDSLKQGNKDKFYSSPETQQDIEHPSSDVYALGIMFYEFLFGENLS